MLVDRLGGRRELSQSPVFQVMFSFLQSPRFAGQLGALALGDQHARIPFGPLTLAALPLGPKAAQFDLTLTMAVAEGGIAGAFDYSLDLFEAATVERTAAHFLVLLEDIVRRPDAPVSLLRVLPESERQQLRAWHTTQLARPGEETIHQLFEAQAERTPDACAVVHRDKSLSYRELNEQANQLARHLRALDVGPEARAGILLHSSADSLVAVLAILKAGGCYVPLDPTLAPGRIAELIELAGVRILVTAERFLADLPALSLPLVYLDRDRDRIAGLAGTNLPPSATPRNLSHVIFTSGSTGPAKGVMVEHASVVNLHHAVQARVYAHHAGQRLRVGLISPLFFDGSVREYLMLLSGHTVDVVPAELRRDGAGLLRYLSSHEVDEFYCTPSQFHLLADAGMLSGAHYLPQVVLLGGEAVDPALWQTLAAHDSIRFWNIYGPTECTVDAVAAPVSTDHGGPVLGRPLGNYQLYVLDPQLNPTPIGVPGELYVGGIGVSRGYIRSPALTAQAFVPDPFADQPGRRLFRTRDLARFLPSGDLEFLGRADRQLKIRGYRIDLPEIEAALRRHPSVRDATLAVREDLPGHPRLVAYLTPDGGRVSVEQIRSFLRETLPEYMLPSFAVWLLALPLTPNGKIDHRRLPPPPAERPELDTSYHEPASSAERALTAIWETILGVRQPGVEDNFFDLGGTSLMLIRLQADLGERLAVDVPVVELFQYPTIRSLAAHLAATAAVPADGLDRARAIGARRRQLTGRRTPPRQRPDETG